MPNPEINQQVVFVIAGGTSTAKTRLLTEIGNVLRMGHGLRTAILSVGDIFRYLAQHERVPWHIPQDASDAARIVLEDTTIEIAPDGKVLLADKGKHFEQNFTNGNNAADVSKIVSPVVEAFMSDRIQPQLAGFDVVGIDGRNRWLNAQILMITHATDETRVAIHEIERSEGSLSYQTRLDAIRTRDAKDSRFWDQLYREQVNVVHLQVAGSSDSYVSSLAGKAAGVIVDFSSERMPSPFGSITIS